MTKQELITKLESLLANSETGQIINDIRALQTEYLRILEDLKRHQLDDFVAAGGNRKEYEYRKDSEDKIIESLFEKYKERKRKFDIQKSEQERANLNAKRELIDKINLLVNEENIGKAIISFREIQQQWKDIGAVHPEKFRELQNDYSKALESFNYNLTIYKELKDYDFKKNFETKEAIVAKIKELVSKETLKEIDELLRAFRSEWDEIGPVAQEKWLELKDDYRKAMDLVYERINHLKDIRQSERKENLAKKEAITDKIIAISSEIPTSLKGWNNRTEEIKKLQEEWNSIGKGEKAKEENAYQRFREASNIFFNRKKEFFAGLKEDQEKNKTIKEQLIAKAEELKNSTNWKETSDAFIKLQKEWQKVGPTLQHIENRLWAKFREACNDFFSARTSFQQSIEKSFEENLNKKKALLEEAKAFILAGNIETDKHALIDLKNKWAQAGHVSVKDKKTLNDEFFKTIDAHFEKLQLDKKEQEVIRIQNKIDRILEFDNASELLKKEIDFIRKKADELKTENIKFENNIGFLRNAEALKKDVMAKIEKNKNIITEYTERIKTFQIALRNLTKPLNSEEQTEKTAQV
jgi:hypothetical protein